MNLFVFISSSIQMAGLPSSEITNLPNVLSFFLCGVCAKTQPHWEFPESDINFCNSHHTKQNFPLYKLL